MNMIEPIIQELTYECGTTRKLLERIPENQFSWKPHQKSMTLVQLASHIVNILEWADETINVDKFEMKSDEYIPYEAKSKAELLKKYDLNLKKTLEVMKGVSNEKLMKSWSFWVDGHKAFEMPRIGVIRGFIISHLIHHRGQLSVYLRIKDVPIPSIYGPSADEQPEYK